jgi:hypothetical protein
MKSMILLPNLLIDTGTQTELASNQTIPEIIASFTHFLQTLNKIHWFINIPGMDNNPFKAL